MRPSKVGQTETKAEAPGASCERHSEQNFLTLKDTVCTHGDVLPRLRVTGVLVEEVSASDGVKVLELDARAARGITTCPTH